MKKTLLFLCFFIFFFVSCDSYTEMNEDDLIKFDKISYLILNDDESWNLNYKFNLDNNSIISSENLYISRGSSLNFNELNLEKEKMKIFIQTIVNDKNNYELSGIIRSDHIINYKILEENKSFDENFMVQNIYLMFSKDYKIIVNLQLKKQNSKLITYSFEFNFSTLNIDLSNYDIVLH
jgi:hypothetical protein